MPVSLTESDSFFHFMKMSNEPVNTTEIGKAKFGAKFYLVSL